MERDIGVEHGEGDGDTGPDGELSVYPVPAEMIDRVLPVIREDLERAVRHSVDATMEDVLAQLREGRVYLHMAFRGEDYIGFAICDIRPFVNGPRAHIHFLAGDGILDAIELYHREMRNLGIRVATFASHRRGWMRKSIGYEPAYTVYRKVL